MMNPKLLAKLQQAEASKKKAEGAKTNPAPAGPSNKAEKVVIGYKNPTTAGKLYVLVRDVNEFSGDCHSFYTDEVDGTQVGVHLQRIHSKREVADQEINDYLDAGWKLEPGSHPAREQLDYDE